MMSDEERVPILKASFKTVIARSFIGKTLNLRESVARDNLANERTYLAWVRTGFAISALGVVLSRLHLTCTKNDVDDIFFKILSLAFIAIGIISLLIGSWRYAQVQYYLESGYFPTAGLAVVILTILGMIAFIVVFVVLLL